MAKRRSLYISLAIALLLVVFIAFYSYGFYKVEYKRNPLVQENLTKFDFDYVYNAYLDPTPNIKNRTYYGMANASITIIAYLNPKSSASRYFVNQIFPVLEKEYINTGKVRFYGKHYLTKGDLEEREKNQAFLSSLYLDCIDTLKKDEYYKFYFELFKEPNNQSNKIDRLMEDMVNRSNYQNSFKRCVKEQKLYNVKRDVAEIEIFGIASITPRFYIGFKGMDNTELEAVPSITKFRTVIKQYQVIIGD